MSLLFFPYNNRLVFYNTIVSLLSVKAESTGKNRTSFSRRTMHLGTVVQEQPPLPPPRLYFLDTQLELFFLSLSA